MQIKAGASPLGGGMVRLAWQVIPGDTLELLVNSTDQGQILTASTVAILEAQPVGKNTYQLVDRATGTKSNLLTVNVT